MLVPGHYSIRKVVLQAENVAFQHEYDFQSGNSLTSSVDDTIPEPLDNEAPKVILWPSRRSLEVEAFWCREIHLENLKAIVFEINSGENEVSGGKLLVKAGSAGLRLHTADAVAIANDRSFAIKSQQGMVSFGHLSPSSTLQIKIPYQLDTDMKEISIRSEVVYSTHTGEYTCGSSHHLAVVLPLGVNVQDIFKEHALFSKFSISSSTQIPLRILECELEGTPDFAATTPFMDKSGLYVFSKQPASLVYQIRRRLTHQAGKAPQTKLLLHVKYQCLNEEIVALLQSRLTEALDESSYAGYANLLVPHLLSTLIEKLPHQDLELIGLLREIGLPQYSDFKWDVTLSAIPPSERSDVSGWLQKWHKVVASIYC